MQKSATKISTVIIDGATGYIGSHLVAALKKSADDDLQIRCLVRPNTKEVNIDFLRQHTNAIMQADLSDTLESLPAFFAQADIAFHLIGTIAPKHGETPESIHIDQTKRFVELCQKAQVGKIIMVSACGVDGSSEIAYLRTKWQAEQVIKESGVSAIIVRPSLIIGRQTGSRNSKLVTRLQDLIQNKNIVPLLCGGKNKLQPLFIGDLSEALIQCMFELEGACGENTPILELGGSEILTMKEFTQRLMNSMAVEKPFVDVPAAIAWAAALSSETFQNAPILSRDQVKLSQQDNICADNKLPELLKRSPMAIEEALASYK